MAFAARMDSSKTEDSIDAAEISGSCSRCGEALHWAGPPLPTILVLQRTPRTDHVVRLAELEGVSVELAAEWVRHVYHKECDQRVAHCPKCGGLLRTDRARQCPHCLHSWHHLPRPE